MWGNNTLWIESAPDVGDFAPVEMKHGSFLRFNGHDARHFTRPNDTGKTRVSFDLRCVPVSLYKQHGGGVGRARDKGKIGDYRAKRTGAGDAPARVTSGQPKPKPRQPYLVIQ